MRTLRNFIRGLIGVVVVLSMILLVVVAGWALGVWLSSVLGVAATWPVIVCMVVPLLALGLWMEPTKRLRWFFPDD